VIRRIMGLMRRLMPGDPRGENARAVSVIRNLGVAADWLQGWPLRRKLARVFGRPTWPVTSGAYVVGDRHTTVAVCCLTSDELILPLARLAGVAIAGRVHTPNLGIEKIIFM
jgi:hypothetical protein